MAKIQKWKPNEGSDLKSIHVEPTDYDDEGNVSKAYIWPASIPRPTNPIHWGIKSIRDLYRPEGEGE